MSSSSSEADTAGRLKDLGRESRLSFRNIAEHQLRRELKEKALEICDPVIKSFAECSQEKGLWVIFSCKEQFKKVNECLNQYNGDTKMKSKAELSEKRECEGLETNSGEWWLISRHTILIFHQMNSSICPSVTVACAFF